MKVTVLYADLTSQTADIEALETVPHTGVLGILVKRDDGALLHQATGMDHYAVCWGDQGWGQWAFVFGMDDGEFGHRYEDDHMQVQDGDVPVPLGCLHVWFEAQRVTDEVWSQAKRVLSGLLR